MLRRQLGTVSSQAGKVGTLGAWSLEEEMVPLFNAQDRKAQIRCAPSRGSRMAHPDLMGSWEGQMHKENETRCRMPVRHTNSQSLLNSRWERHPVARLCWEGGSSAEAGSAELLPNTVCFSFSVAPVLMAPSAPGLSFPAGTLAPRPVGARALLSPQRKRLRWISSPKALTYAPSRTGTATP